MLFHRIIIGERKIQSLFEKKDFICKISHCDISLIVIYDYIYMYIYVCVCICIYIYFICA